MVGLAWWVFVMAGLALLLGELMTASFVLIWFALGALIVGLASALLDLSLAAQLLIWSAASILMTWLWFAKLRSLWMPPKTQLGQSDPGIVGEVGLAVTEIAPFKRGKVRFQCPLAGSDVWECFSDDAIAIGERVRVVSIEGNRLKVSLNRHASETSHE